MDQLKEGLTFRDTRDKSDWEIIAVGSATTGFLEGHDVWHNGQLIFSRWTYRLRNERDVVRELEDYELVDPPYIMVVY